MNSDSNLLNFILNVGKDRLQNIAKWSLGMWIVYPLIIMLLNALGVEGIYIYLMWMYVLYFVGAIGLVVGLIRLFQVVYNDDFEIKRYAINYLPLLFLILFLIWSFVSCALSTNKHMAFYGMMPMTTSWFTFLFFGGFLVLSMVLSENRQLLLKTAKLFVWVSFVLAIVTLLDNGFSDMLTIVEPYTNCFHYQSVFYNTNHYAYYLLVSILTSFFVALYSDDYKVKIVYILPYVIGIVVLIYNNTLGAFLSLAITMLFILLWFIINKEERLSMVVSLIIIFCITIIVTSFFNDNLKVSLFGVTSDFSTIIGDDDVSMVGSGRGELWSNAIDCIKSQPIFGCGFENHGTYSIGEDGTGLFVTAPHNYFLFLGKHTGVPGLCFVLITFLIGIIRLLKEKNKIDGYSKSAAFIIVAFLMSAFFGVVKFYTEPYFVIAMGVCMEECTKFKNNI
ncbi:MAG: O-antigen ligase family protein [Oscillospiraceae bacterium]|nr:O-antigen ligase family protein [Candidatus Limimonas egerieequi]